MITSTNNPQYKQFVKLATQSRARKKAGQTVLHGIHLANAYLERGLKPLQVVYSNKAEVNPEVDEIVGRCEFYGIEVLCFPENTDKIVAGVDNGAAVAFVIETPVNGEAPAIKDGALLLDTVQDPTNVGALIRTAVAAGVSAVYLSEGCASAWSPKALRAGMGGQLAVSIYEDCDLLSLVEVTDVQVLATALGAERTIYEADLSKPSAWLLGNEGAGVSTKLLESNVKKVIIPQEDGVESLNVAAAAAVCLFEWRRSKLFQ